MGSFKCRLCGSDNLSLYSTHGNAHEYKYYRCPDCGLVNYDMSSGLDQGKYGVEFVDPRESHKSNEIKTQTYRFIKKRIPSRGRLLDIGCGSGRLLYLAREDGWDVSGFELSPYLAGCLGEKLGIGVKVGNFLEDDLGEEKGRYDLVTLIHVLEHLPDPLLAMSRIGELLKPEGCAVLEFPNITGLDPRIKRLMRRAGVYKKKYPPGWVPGHCNEYCEESFRFLARKTGFEIEVWQTYSSKASLNTLYNAFKWGNKARVLIRKTRREGTV
ncbi:MAG: class I SAM-dependent methyltransferase [Pseudomonadota bacterium]